jgi:hypothetical protein
MHWSPQPAPVDDQLDQSRAARHEGMDASCGFPNTAAPPGRDSVIRSSMRPAGCDTDR